MQVEPFLLLDIVSQDRKKEFIIGISFHTDFELVSIMVLIEWYITATPDGVLF